MYVYLSCAIWFLNKSFKIGIFFREKNISGPNGDLNVSSLFKKKTKLLSPES